MSAAAWPTVLQPVVRFYEGLDAAALDRIGEIYTERARFKDPFNDVCGTDAIAGIFRHMYATTLTPRFVVTAAAASPDGREGFLTWEFHFRFRRYRPDTELTIRGATHLRLADDGRVCEHRDYWDAAEELYEKLPLIGTLMRGIKRRMA